MAPPKFSQMSVASLRKACGERGIDPSAMDKEDMLASLYSHEHKQQADEASAVKLKELELEKLKLELETAKVRHNAEHQLLVEERRLLETKLELEGHKLTPATTESTKGPKIPQFYEGEDVEVYLTTFERLATANGWPKSRWAPKLAALLSGKAREAFVQLSEIDSMDYDKVKLAIYAKYELTAEEYRHRFRTSRKQPSDSYKEWLCKLNVGLGRWADAAERERQKKDDTKEQFLTKLIIREQFLEGCPPDLADKLQEQDIWEPKDLATAADRITNKHKFANSGASSSSPQLTCSYCKNPGHDIRSCKKLKAKPQNSMFCDGRYQFWDSDQPIPDNKWSMEGAIDGRRVHIYRDTGSTMTFVNGKYVSQKSYLGDFIRVRMANGTVDEIPTALVTLNVAGEQKQIEVGVMNTPFPVLLGNDYHTACVVTRAQAHRAHAAEEKIAEEASTSDVHPTPLYTLDDTTRENSDDHAIADPLGTADEDEGDIAAPLGVPHHAPTLTTSLDAADDASVFDVTPQRLLAQQSADQSLQSAWRDAIPELESRHLQTCYVKRYGYLMRKWTPTQRQGEDGAAPGMSPVFQVVVPAEHRIQVLRLAHTIPLAGHLGITRTRERILQHFYWPGLFRDVKRFCKGCPECQRSATRRAGEKHTMVAPPIIGKPFRRIGIDIVGPLQRSNSGNKFILTMVDHATRYPEAIPLPSTEAERVAKALMTFFSRVGIPEEILTDQGANFLSTVLTQMCEKLGIHKLRTSPYHPQTNGVCERFNGTLKAMLRKLVSEDAKDWDDYLPFVCFAYRETPCASTGFSPFELTFGRQVRGPLMVLRETWLDEEEQEDSLADYITDLKTKLEWMQEWSLQQQETTQKKSKAWYDKTARDREFSVGDQVLVLLPSATSKLQRQWRGPYTIMQKMNSVDYKVDTGRRTKRIRIYHVNLLRPWEQPMQVAGSTTLEEDLPGLDTAVSESAELSEITYGPDLSDMQLAELHCLVRKHSAVISGNPGKTTAAEFDILTHNDQPTHQRAYPIPHKVRPELQREIHNLQKLGIIQESESPYNAPIVLVNKKDGGVRMCVDYRKLNNETIADRYPMPRIDEIIDGVGASRYISVIDLTKGFYQIPLSSRARSKSAFQTFLGHFEFTRMPFGMKNAPACFQRMMDKILRGAEEYARAVMDDIVVSSLTWEDHLNHLDDIFARLAKACLTVKPSKCRLAMPRADYLGKVVGQGEVCPMSSKVAAIQNTPAPKTKKGVRAFIGLVNYYKDFIANMANVAAPLTDLLKKNQPNHINWTPQCAAAFNKLKEALRHEPVLKIANHDKPFIVQVDACDNGIGAVLSQRDAAGCDHPIAYRSRKLTDRQRKWSTIEKECYAILFATEQFRYYIYGRPFTVQSDHKPLTWLGQLRDKNRRLMRWSFLLQEHDIVFEHKKGVQNGNADGLSRAWDI
ncbi:GIN1 [Branchiostoma lanceolatum]|uniref:Gypsy retrotransposon integrase-like protein 1 n=1 Tax=Branchiostoma lanceolatum TaxID=7740 RepID=A0A8J9YY03_BRALA|nr:GIN1 [Branchiostoma lanceolatum]